MKIQSLLATLVLGLSMVLGACTFNGGVEQGRCVAYDENTKEVTLVVDSAIDSQNPKYNIESSVDNFKMPTNPIDIGPLPKAGGLLMVDTDKKEVFIYNPETKKVEELKVEFANIEKGVNAKAAAAKKLPIIDKENSTVTVYVPRHKELVTFKVTPEQLAMPAYEWTLGDEVRVAFRNDNRHQAIRFMNVTQTNIYAR